MNCNFPLLSLPQFYYPKYHPTFILKKIKNKRPKPSKIPNSDLRICLKLLILLLRTNFPVSIKIIFNSYKTGKKFVLIALPQHYLNLLILTIYSHILLLYHASLQAVLSFRQLFQQLQLLFQKHP